MSVIPCKTTIAENSRAFGFNVGKLVPHSDGAWRKTQVTGGRMMQHMQRGNALAVRQSGGGADIPHSCAAWLSPRKSLISFPYPAPTEPIRHITCYGKWVIGGYSSAIPSSVSSYAEYKNGFNLWEPNGPMYTHWGDLEHYAGGALCWVDWPAAIWHLWAENVFLRTSNGQRVFDFTKSVFAWHKATKMGNLPGVPAHRPFDWPNGPSEHSSYLAAYTEDMSYGGSALGAVIPLNPGGTRPLGYVVPDPQTAIHSSRIDNSKFPGLLVHMDDEKVPISSWSQTDQGKRTAGSYWDWSEATARERYLYWQLANDGYPNLEDEGLPELLFPSQSGHPEKSLPPDETAFDLNLLVEKWAYSILRADRYSYEIPGSDPPTYSYDLAPVVIESHPMDTCISGSLSQLVPVPPKARAQGA